MEIRLIFDESDVQEIMARFPVSVGKLKEFMVELFKDSENPLDAKDLDAALPMIILYTPRTLYDFFDIQNIYVSVFYLEYWKFTANDISGPTGYHTRQEAEKHGFKKAFELLEK